MDLNDFRNKLKLALGVISEDVSKIRVGRANPSIVENVIVPAYGGAQMLKVVELASIVVEDAQTLVIKPWDQSIIGEIAKAINSSDLGLNASIETQIIRIKIPPLTEERRREFVKLLGSKVEQGKVNIRHIRQDVMSDLKKIFENKEIGEDEKHRLEKDIQKIVDEHIEQVDAIFEDKELELLKI